MNRMSQYTVGLIAAVVYASTAVAQDSGTAPATPASTTTDAVASKPFSFGILGGATVPTGNFSDGAGTGWHAGAFITAANAAWPISFRVEGIYNRFGSKDVTVSAGTKLNEQPSITSGTVEGVWSFPTSGDIRPYLIGGVGLYHLSIDETCTTTTVGGCTGLGGSVSTNRFGLNAGGGIDFHLSGFSTFVEARWTDIFTQGNASQMVPISVGIKF